MIRISVPIRSLLAASRTRMLYETIMGVLITFVVWLTPAIASLPISILIGGWVFSFLPRLSMNPMLSARIIVLVTPGLISALVIWIDPNLTVAAFWTEFQNPEITAKV